MTSLPPTASSNSRRRRALRRIRALSLSGSAVKNRQRWNFGGLFPQAYSEAQTGSDAWTMQTECLIDQATHPTVDDQGPVLASARFARWDDLTSPRARIRRLGQRSRNM